MTKLTVWVAMNPAPKDKRGALIAATLPNDRVRYKKDLQDNFFDGQLIKATNINREKVNGRFYIYFNIECDNGEIRNIDGGRVKLRKIEEEECNMVLIPLKST